jgi:hypothetical protein
MPAPRRRWPWVLAVLGGTLAAAVTSTVACVDRVASARFAEFERRQAARIAAFEAETGGREPLLGPPRPGNAWDEYAPAVAAIKARPEEERTAVAEFVDARPGTDPAKAYAAVEAAAGALDRLRDGARCGRARYSIDAKLGMSATLPSLVDLQRAGQLLAVSARRRREADDIDGAIDDHAALLQFGTDIGQVPSLICAMIAVAVLRLGQNEMKELVADPRLSAGALERLDRLLEAADRRLPEFATTLSGEHLLMAQSLRAAAAAGGHPDLPSLRLLAWRKMFSARILVAESSDHYEAMIDAARQSETLEIGEANRMLQQVHLEILEAGNPLTRMLVPGVGRLASSFREARARLRVLRAAVMTRRGQGPGSPGWPVDPFTMRPVDRRDEPAAIKLISAWRDGVAGGTGQWDAKDRDDLVLELPKR